MQLIFSKAGAVGGGMTLNGRGVLPMAWVATGARLQMRPPRGAGTVAGVAGPWSEEPLQAKASASRRPDRRWRHGRISVLIK